ncbi:hypothetical protein [Companilactobacillus versmoldensis]|uniref:hypothetical protein n=1 Tax=Companilactobacillus versmoldensis TaxID=194326 RepID=UPI00024923DD|nr:hypothetical protein [Companilactobacillus versmoldensis]
MAKNTLIDLNNHLFEQLERLNDESMLPGKFQREVMRSDAMGKVAENIIRNANVILKAKQSYPFAECVDFRSACAIADTITEHIPQENGKRITFLIQP